MVALPTSPGQAINPGEVLRKLLALHVLRVQLHVRPNCVVGQAMVLGCQAMLVWLSTSGKENHHGIFNIIMYD